MEKWRRKNRERRELVYDCLVVKKGGAEERQAETADRGKGGGRREDNERRRAEGQKGEAEHKGGRRGEWRRAEGRERLNFQFECRQFPFSTTTLCIIHKSLATLISGVELRRPCNEKTVHQILKHVRY